MMSVPKPEKEGQNKKKKKNKNKHFQQKRVIFFRRVHY